jgi:DNA-binding phage protein
MMTIAQQIQQVLRTKGHSSSAVVQTLGNNTLQVSCSTSDEPNVNTVMNMINAWNLKAETRVGNSVIKTYKGDHH